MLAHPNPRGFLAEPDVSRNTRDRPVRRRGIRLGMDDDLDGLGPDFICVFNWHGGIFFFHSPCPYYPRSNSTPIRAQTGAEVIGETPTKTILDLGHFSYDMKKGPVAGWGWPSLIGRPLPAPHKGAERHGLMICEIVVKQQFHPAPLPDYAPWNFSCAACRPSRISSSAASAASSRRNGRSLRSAVPKSRSTKSAVSIRPGGRPTPTLTR